MSIMIIPKILWTISLAALLMSAATDLKDRIIPNELAAVVALCGLLLCLTVRPGQLGLSLAAATLVFLALGLLCRYGALGGGDVKLMVAVTLLVPPGGVGGLLAGIALAGGFLSCLYLGVSYLVRTDPVASCNPGRENPTSSFAVWASVERARIASRKEVPYALAILGGVVWHVAREGLPCSAISCSF